MSSPEAIKKNIDSLIKDMEGKAPFYTPDWQYGDQDDPATALLNIFAYLSEIVIKRLNQAPDKHFLGFLETVGASLLPAQSANAPLTFVPGKGATGGILIPALTQASAAGADGKPVIFETESNTIATPSKLLSVYTIIKNGDLIFGHKSAINGTASSTLFMGDNLQEHILYIGDKDLLNIKKAVITVYPNGIDEKLLNKLKDVNYVEWEYGVEVAKKENGKDVFVLSWLPFTKVAADGMKLYLYKDSGLTISETELYNGIKSRWIRCNVKKSKIEELKNIRLNTLWISASTGIEKTIPVKKVQGIGDEFFERLAGKDVVDKIETVDELLRLSPEKLSERLRCSKTRAVNILEAAKKVFYDKTGKYESIKIEGILPDMVFFNDVPVDFEKEFHPFGGKPQIYASLYIGSEEAFSKKGYEVKMNLTLRRGLPSDSENPPELSWEYWDGEGWCRIKDIKENFAGDSTCNASFNRAKTVECTVTMASLPPIKKTKVNGKENYWIRVRLTGGDFGKEIKISGNVVQEGNFCPPEIRTLSIQYQKDKGDAPEFVITKNNLVTEIIKDSFRPFKPSPDVYPALYFAFDKRIKGGPVGLFVNIDERFGYPEDFRPRVKWEFYSGEGGWKEADLLDGTNGFTKTGIIQFVITEEMMPLSILGETGLYWLRCMITEDFFDLSIKDKSLPILYKYIDVFRRYRGDILKDLSLAPLLKANPGGVKSASIEECKDEITIYNLSLLINKAKKLPPSILGFYLNTVWAVQSGSIKDEICGSSTGEPGQEMVLLNTPVIRKEIWVDEFNSLSEGEREMLRKEGIYQTEASKDEKGNEVGFWIKWEESGDFIGSCNSDRHYVIDRAGGKVWFGDGNHGMIPPLGKDNVKARYSYGGGKAGNLKSNAISSLETSISFIDKVFNPVASEGGIGTEDRDSLIRRAPSVLRNRHRAVALDDYEWLAKEASRDIARVKVLPNFNENGRYKTGWVTVVIVPEGGEDNPSPSPSLMRKVKNYLKDRSPNVAEIRVIQPSYVRADISAELKTGVIDAMPIIEYRAKIRLSEFLHPLTGGERGEGWEFGSAPCLSDMYSILEDIEDVDHVGKLVMSLWTGEGSRIGEITDASGIIKLPVYALIYSGEHKIRAKYGI